MRIDTQIKVNYKIKFKYFSKLKKIKYNKLGHIVEGIVETIKFPEYFIITENYGKLKINHWQIICKLK